MTELERFLVLFDRLFHFTTEAVERTPAALLDAPPPADGVRFGERVASVTVRTLCAHLSVGERCWFRALAQAAEGATIPTPDDPELTRRLLEGDTAAIARELHEADMALLRALDPRVLERSVVFSDRTWSGMGLLWAVYGHRNYHLGNIDLLWRMGGAEAPDYFAFDPPEMA